MKKSTKEIIKLTTKEIILSFCDFAAPFFSSSSIYRKSYENYISERNVERSEFLQKLKYLKRKGYIETFAINREKYFELTEKGFKKLQKFSIDGLAIKRPMKWDKKWRMVIFDVPEKLRHSRDILRLKLNELGFIQIQKSVYIFPFECTKEITLLSKYLFITKNVTILIAEIIQGEEQILETFISSSVLSEQDIAN